MEEMLHQLIGSSSSYLQGFMHLRWCRISSIDGRIVLQSLDLFFFVCKRRLFETSEHRPIERSDRIFVAEINDGAVHAWTLQLRPALTGGF